MVNPAGRKTCDQSVHDFIRRPFINYLNISQSVGLILSRAYNWQILEVEAYPRVDVLVHDANQDRQFRLELVYITPMIRYKSKLEGKIDATRRRIEKKSLDG